MNICIVTGGTGGHIYPALAFADILSKEEKDFIYFIGNDDRMEAELIPQQGYVFEALHTSGLSRSPIQSAKALGQFGKALFQAKRILKARQSDLVIGFGGYVSAPVMLAAQSLGIPTIIHEQNSISGKSNKLAAKKADAIVTCYPLASSQYPEEKVRLLGNPRATLVYEGKGDLEYYRSLGLDEKKRTIMIMMGSLGSSSVNDLMTEALRDIQGIQILYVCGKNNPLSPDAFENPDVVVAEYVDTMKIYPFLDGLICRAGATTLAEITALGLPAVLIPSPYVANNHQFYNASQLVEQQAALMIEEKDLNAHTLKQAIEKAFLDEENYRQLSRQAAAIGKPQAAYDMIKLTRQFTKKCKGSD